MIDMESTYSFKELAPAAFADYVVFDIDSNFVGADFLAACLDSLIIYNSSEELSRRNIILEYSIGGSNLFHNYAEVLDVPQYAYDKNGMPKGHIDSLTRDITDSSSKALIVSPSNTVDRHSDILDKFSMEFRWPIRRPAVGFFNDKFSNYDYFIIGVDAAVVNDNKHSDVFEVIDELVFSNINSRILLTNTLECKKYGTSLFIDRYKNRVHLRSTIGGDGGRLGAHGESDITSRTCADICLLTKCDHLVLGDSQFSVVANIFLKDTVDRITHISDAEDIFSNMIHNEEE